MQSGSSYASYLLRLQQVQNDGQAIWVASIQSTETREQRRFASVDGLLEFLRSEYGDCDVRFGEDAGATAARRAETDRAD